MKRKSLLALILALLMLLALFGACTKTTKDPGKTSDKPTNNVDRSEVKTLTILNSVGMGASRKTWEEAMDEKIPLALYFEDLALKEYALKFDRTNVLSDAYATTLTGHIAANTLHDRFTMPGNVEASTWYGMVDNGQLHSLDDVFAYSNGCGYGVWYDDGVNSIDRAANLLPDGKWYWFCLPNGNLNQLDLSSTNPDGYMCTFGVFVVYPANIRYDWLQKVGLGMPRSLDEIYEACLAFNEQDVNGNGVHDEHVVIPLGTASQYSGGFINYFGLHHRYQPDMTNGEIFLPELEPGYLPFLEFCKRLYDKNLVQLEETTMIWNYGVDTAGNYTSIYVQYPDNMQFVDTGDGDENYRPIPIIQALPDVKPTFTWQSAISKLGLNTFSSTADPDTCARWIDYITSPEYTLSFEYGLKGTAWDIVDGRLVAFELSQDQIDKGYNFKGQWFMNAGGNPECWMGPWYSPNATYEYSIEESIANGTPETMRGQLIGTHEAWVEKNKIAHPWITMDTPNGITACLQHLADFGLENILLINPTSGHFLAYSTLEEGAVMTQYNADMTAHLNGMTSGFVTGKYTADKYDGLIETAFSMGLGEILNVYQSRANRVLEAMGKPAIPLKYK